MVEFSGTQASPVHAVSMAAGLRCGNDEGDQHPVECETRKTANGYGQENAEYRLTRGNLVGFRHADAKGDDPPDRSDESSAEGDEVPYARCSEAIAIGPECRLKRPTDSGAEHQ